MKQSAFFKALLTGISLFGASATGAAEPPAQAVAAADTDPAIVKKWCDDLKSELESFKWKIEPCEGLGWKSGGTSVEGRPLMYMEFGPADAPQENTTLILAAVHGDEITPVYFGIELARWVKQNQESLGKSRVVIAPLVNPDGFYRRPRTRMNARGVDVNRNFLTRDWQAKALAEWKRKLHSDPRRYPGSEPRSEPETLFQEELIHRIRPQKILSIHSPLNHLDYDGPTTMTLQKYPRDYVSECLKLRKKLHAVSTGYFPGSLGNFAGQELGIPTITLELPSSDPTKAERYWKQFSQGIKTMIDFVVPSYAWGDFPTRG